MTAADRSFYGFLSQQPRFSQWPDRVRGFDGDGIASFLSPFPSPSHFYPIYASIEWAFSPLKRDIGLKSQTSLVRRGERFQHFYFENWMSNQPDLKKVMRLNLIVEYYCISIEGKELKAHMIERHFLFHSALAMAWLVLRLHFYSTWVNFDSSQN